MRKREKEPFNVIYIAGLNEKKVFHSLAVGLSWLKYLPKLFLPDLSPIDVFSVGTKKNWALIPFMLSKPSQIITRKN